MDDKRIEAALAGLAQQMPRAPVRCIEKVQQAVQMFEQKRLSSPGNAAAAEQKQAQPSAAEKTKDQNKTL